MRRPGHAPRRQTPRPTSRRALTLVEMVVSVAVVSVLAVSMGSAILIASRALPDADNPAARSLEAAAVVDQMAGELYSAVSVTYFSATAIEFTVERGGANHTIRYQWSGTPGDPLARRYDGGASVNVLEDVRGFTLTYHMKTTTVTSTEIDESDEVLLASFTGWPGLTAEEETVGLDSVTWAGQFFEAAVPDNVKKLNVTRVCLKMRQGANGAGSTFTVAIHRAVGGGNAEPQANPVGTPVTTPGSYLPTSYEWREFLFSDVSISNPGKEYVIVAKGTGQANPSNADGDVLHLHANDAPENGTVAIWTQREGSSWDPKKNIRQYYDHPFYVYGTYQTEVTVQRPSNILELTGIELLGGLAPTVRVRTETQVLNRPELPDQ